MSRSTETVWGALWLTIWLKIVAQSSKSSASCRISRKKNSNRDSKKSKRDATLALSLDHARDFLSSICIVAYRTSRFAFRYPNKSGSHKLPLEVKAHSVEARILLILHLQLHRICIMAKGERERRRNITYRFSCQGWLRGKKEEKKIRAR